MSLILGIDTGGTYTDGVILEREQRRIITKAKALTTRNDLADPFLFGLSSGASAGAVLVITRFGERLGALTLPVSAFVGGLCSAVAVMLLAISWAGA